MPAKNLYHDAVRAALEADGWTITDDPLGVLVGGRRLFVDLGAEHGSLEAERAGERIAVEVQSSLSRSPIDDSHRAVGQYVVYRAALRRTARPRELYSAVTEDVYDGIWSEPLGRVVVADAGIRVLLFDPTQRRVVRWIS